MIDTRESATAKLCSFARAYHSQSNDQKIFDDYLAYDLMGKEDYKEIGQLIEHDFDEKQCHIHNNFKEQVVYPIIQKYISPILLSRIAYSEEKLLSFAKRHEKCQYVICGAGMDTFSFRNKNKNIEIFELDHPDTQRYKLEKIHNAKWEIPQNVHFVPIDFAKDNMTDVLLKQGFDTQIPTFFAILGVTYYLTLPVFEQTIAMISQSAESSELIFDFPDETTFGHTAAKRMQRLLEITAKLGEPMKHGFSIEELNTALRSHGFRIKEHLSPQKIQNRFFVNRSDGQYAFENIHLILAATA